MANKDYWLPGTWNAYCAVCGFKFKANELIQRWDGFYVCQQDWEPRHVLDFFEVRPENMSVPWSQNNESITLVANVTASATLTAANLATYEYKLIIDATGGPVTLTLPVANTLPYWVTRVSIARADSTGNAVVVQANVSDTMNGSTTVSVGDRYDLLINGNTWTRT